MWPFGTIRELRSIIVDLKSDCRLLMTSRDKARQETICSRCHGASVERDDLLEDIAMIARTVAFEKGGTCRSDVTDKLINAFREARKGTRAD